MATPDYKPLLNSSENLKALIQAQNDAGIDAALLSGSEPVDVLTAKAVFNANDRAEASIEGTYGYAFYSMGDSLTAGGTYQARLMTHLSGWFDVNYGISGQTTTTMASRFAQNVTAKGDANYVAIWGGINDIVANASAATIQNNLQAMYTAAQSAGTKVIAIKISPFKTNADWSAPRQAVLDAVNAWISSSATGVDFIADAFTLLEDPSAPDTLLPAYDSGDHLHLSTAGYNAVGDLVASVVGTFTATKGQDLFIAFGSGASLEQNGSSWNVAGSLVVESDADATVMGGGSVYSRGGFSFTKAGRVGTSLDVGTDLVVRGTSNTSGVGTGSLQVPSGGAYIGGNIVGAGYLSVPGSITSSSNGTITGGSIVCNATSGGIEAIQPGTSYRYLRQASTGGQLYVGLESSVGGGFFTGSAAYESVWYSPSNNTYFRTPQTRHSGTISTTSNIAWDLGAANVVSPTSPNRTIAVTVAGTTYYLAAKTTND